MEIVHYTLVIIVSNVFDVTMSSAACRGEPTAAQAYLDERLRAAGGGAAGGVTLPALLLHCMREHPQDVCLINGSSGASFTNEQLARRAARLARALLARPPRPPPAAPLLCVLHNHQHLVSLYYAALLAGVPVFLLDPNSTPHELCHFLPLVQPGLVACEAARAGAVRAAVSQWGGLSAPDVITHDQLDSFGAGHSDDIASFQPAPPAPSSVAVLLPTSGSTGLPKAAAITHHGLQVQLPSLWSYHGVFPRPTARVLFLSTAQWMTFSNLLTTCPVYRVTVVICPDKTLTSVLRTIETFKPTWLLLVPGTAAALSEAATSGQLAPLRHVVVTGAPPAPAALRRLAALAPQAAVCNSYGMTEAMGFAALAGPGSPLLSIGKIFNIFHYKLVDEAGVQVQRGDQGELYLKGDSIIMGYVKNEVAYQESMTPDGWYKTGDTFTEDEEGHLFFVERKKFWFKYLNYQISPEELESVISGVPGVQEVVVSGTEQGAAAAVVVAPGAVVSREDVHRVVDSTFIEYKRLRGGVAFVPCLPRTHSGKLHRAACAALVARLLAAGECI